MMRMQVRIHTKVWIWKQNRSRRFAYKFVRGVFLGANNGVRKNHGNWCENRCGNWCENWCGNWCENCGGKIGAHFCERGGTVKKKARRKKGGLFSCPQFSHRFPHWCSHRFPHRFSHQFPSLFFTPFFEHKNESGRNCWAGPPRHHYSTSFSMMRKRGSGAKSRFLFFT